MGGGGRFCVGVCVCGTDGTDGTDGTVGTVGTCWLGTIIGLGLGGRAAAVTVGSGGSGGIVGSVGGTGGAADGGFSGRRVLLVAAVVPLLGLRRAARVAAGGLGIIGRSSEGVTGIPDDRRIAPGTRGGLLPFDATVKIPATLPRLCSLGEVLLGIALTIPATLPLRCSIKAFCLCLTVSMERTCSIAAGSSRPMVKPITAGDIGVEPEGSSEGALTSVFRECNPPLIVTRRFFDGGGSGPCGEALGTS